MLTSPPARCCLPGQEFEEGSSEEEQEDIFELEGMMGGALALGGAQQAQQQAQQQALGGFEGSAAAAPADASGSGRAPVDETANKLDSMMELLFQHLKRRCGRGELAAVWATLLGTMERTILHTHRWAAGLAAAVVLVQGCVPVLQGRTEAGAHVHTCCQQVLELTVDNE